MKPRRRLAVCLSLANLLFVEAWVHLHFGFLSRRLKNPLQLNFIVLFDVLLLGLLFFAIDSALARWKGRALARRIGLLVCLLLIAKTLSGAFGFGWTTPYIAFFERGGALPIAAGIGLALLILALLAWFALTPKPMRYAGRIVFALSPLIAINLYLATAAVLRGTQRLADLPPIHGAPAKPGPRVIWIIFDTLDYHYAFEEHPAWLQIPEFERFRNESVDFTYALAPGPRTEISIPSLLTGKLYVDQKIISPNDFNMTFLDGTTEHFRGQPTVFQAAEQSGARTALLGFHLPYGRLIGDQLSYYHWWQWPCEFGGNEPAWESAARAFSFVLSKPITTDDATLRQIRNHKRELAEAEQLASDPTYRLLFFHFFPPHQYAMYDGKTHQYSLGRMYDREGYFHSLALADYTLGELVRSMQASGAWNDTLLIVTADHSWRVAGTQGYAVYPRIPFLCHFPGQQAHVVAPDRMNSLLTKDLLLDYLGGKIADPSALTTWVRNWTKTHPGIPLTDDPPTLPGVVPEWKTTSRSSGLDPSHE